MFFSSSSRLREALKMVGPKKPAKFLPKVLWFIIWDLMKTQTHLKKVEKIMDKKIRAIEKTIKKDTKKEEKELKQLEKADKKRDKVCDYGAKMMKKKKS